MEFSHIYNTGYEVIFVAFSGIIVAQISNFSFTYLSKDRSI